MKIIFAKHIGFCFGVKRAINIAEKSLKEDPKPIQFLGPLVHNEKVIAELKKKGGKIIAHLKEIKSGTLILRAHGEVLNPKKIKTKKILIRDTTCPLVKKVQIIANFLQKSGYKVIIFGDKNHPETKGIKGYTKDRALIIENENQAKAPHFLKKVWGKKIGLVAQTTQNLEKFNKILKILENKANKIKWFNTICPEVIVRQRELDEILKSCDGLLVIGSHTSANTKRLAEKGRKLKKQVFWVNSLEELKRRKIKGVSSLGVVSGTSTPDWEIKKIKKWLDYNPPTTL